MPRLGVVMDPIGSIKPYKDTTLALMLAAQKRGWQLVYFELGDLWLRDGVAWGRGRRVTVADDKRNWYQFDTEAEALRLGELDAILMRKDPPFDMEFVYSTYLLEQAEADGIGEAERGDQQSARIEQGPPQPFAVARGHPLLEAQRRRVQKFIDDRAGHRVQQVRVVPEVEIFGVEKIDLQVNLAVSAGGPTR